jgi:hypothetical protein
LRSILAVTKFNATAGFHAAQDPNKPFGKAAFLDLLADEFFLATSAIKKLVRDVGFRREAFGMFDQFVGPFFQEGNEVFAA